MEKKETKKKIEIIKIYVCMTLLFIASVVVFLFLLYSLVLYTIYTYIYYIPYIFVYL